MRRSIVRGSGPALLATLSLVGCCVREPPTIGVAGSGAAAQGPARRDEADRWSAVRGLEDGTLGPQDRTPLAQQLLVLDGYTRAKRDVGRRDERPTRALFYCAQLNRDFSQCVLFDGADAGAHVTGVEYVISRALYDTLPHGERQFWHAHMGEVDSGVLVAPGLSDEAHRALMGELRTTYGKAWRTWDSEDHALPLGEPTLMWSIAPGKLDAAVRSEMKSRRAR